MWLQWVTSSEVWRLSSQDRLVIIKLVTKYVATDWLKKACNKSVSSIMLNSDWSPTELFRFCLSNLSTYLRVFFYFSPRLDILNSRVRYKMKIKLRHIFFDSLNVKTQFEQKNSSYFISFCGTFLEPIFTLWYFVMILFLLYKYCLFTKLWKAVLLNTSSV